MRVTARPKRRRGERWVAALEMTNKRACEALENVTLRAKNYKSFGDEGFSINGFCPINLIVGRNNIGKSAMLDVVEFATRHTDIYRSGHLGRTPEVSVSKPYEEAEFDAAFASNAGQGTVRGMIWGHRDRCVGRRLTWKLNPPLGVNREFVALELPLRYDLSKIGDHIVASASDPFAGKHFKRLLSNRDIEPEKDDTSDPSSNGRFVTNAIQRFVNKADLNTMLVKKTMLDDLNRVFGPEAHFSEITVQQIENSEYWEVFLAEDRREAVPVSRSGSGLKTILMALTFLRLVPALEKQPTDKYVFAFEELENNLHPAMQRRLFLFLRDFALKHGCVFLLTSHSSVSLDLFLHDQSAQVLHIVDVGGESVCGSLRDRKDAANAIEDLGCRASTLLQANAIIWVEGPSDRIYMKQWINLMSDGQLKEGAHYQCMFYGGSTLAHIAVDDTEAIDSFVDLLNINRNAIFTVDQDKVVTSGKTAEHVQRIGDAIASAGGMAWTTAGKEIENYLPVEALRAHFGNPDLPELGKKKSFGAYLREHVGKEQAGRWKNDKAGFARKIRSHITKEMIEGHLDLGDQVKEVCDKLKRWSGMS